MRYVTTKGILEKRDGRYYVNGYYLTLTYVGSRGLQLGKTVEAFGSVGSCTTFEAGKPPVKKSSILVSELVLFP
ncbi:hypothetical protein [Planktothrix sp.]|uniref:hypothetical protein n=1 Tax=Planktothrix sp. TaxID=3088171 RepID=UPI0038D4569F